MHPAVLMGTGLGGNKSTCCGDNLSHPQPPSCIFLSLFSPSLVLSVCSHLQVIYISLCYGSLLHGVVEQRGAIKWRQVNAQLYSVGMEQHGRTLTCHGRCTPSGNVGGGGEHGWGRGKVGTWGLACFLH